MHPFRLVRRQPIAQWAVGRISMHGWLTIVASLVSLAAFPIFGWHGLLALATMGGTLTIIACILSSGSAQLTASVHTSAKRVTEGEPLSIVLSIRNESGKPTTGMQAILPINDIRAWVALPPLAPQHSHQTTVHLTTLSRTALRIGPLQIRKGDPFGLMQQTMHLSEAITVFVHPTIIRLQPPCTGNPHDYDGDPCSNTVDSSTDFRGLRAYITGDDIRGIHWLSTAKTGNLMMRQYEMTRQDDTCITLDINPHHYANAEEFELAVSAYASIGMRCLALDHPLLVHAGAVHSQPNASMTFLDESCTIVPAHDASHDYVADTLRHTPSASRYWLITGSLHDREQLERSAACLPIDSICMAICASCSGNRSIRHLKNVTLITISELRDMRSLAGDIP